MENLHLEIKLDIFSRLPVESILECKLVCKTWFTLLKKDPLFPQMHLRRRRLLMLQQQQQQLHDDDDDEHPDDVHNNFIYLKYVEINQRSRSQLWYGMYGKNDDEEHSFRALKRINHPTITVGPLRWKHCNLIIGSCNGLICCTIPHHGIYDPIYIFNPITREFVNLPRFIISDEITSKKIYTMVGGFGYSPSTNEYKVVRIFYPNCYRQPQLARVQVYTLGDGNGWRDKGELTIYSICCLGRCVHVNEELHWLVNDDKLKIVAFNLALEEFHLIASPPIIVHGVGDQHQLSLMGRWLCLSHYVELNERVSHVDMWLLKKRTSSTGYDGMNEQEYQNEGWIREFTITIDDFIDPLGLTKRGEILFMKSWSLCIYDLKTATIEVLEEFDDEYCHSSAIPHINSFVSLKALGEKCRRRKKKYVI